MEVDKIQLKQASNSALVSLLNLTVLPLISFIVLVLIYQKTKPATYGRYYALLAIKINLAAAAALFLVSLLMLLLGGFNSMWTWVFVISYFMFIHAMFILFAAWTLTRSWTGKKLTMSLSANKVL